MNQQDVDDTRHSSDVLVVLYLRNMPLLLAQAC